MLYVLIGLGVIALYFVFVYNNLVKARQQVKEAWSTIDTQLKRRYDLIPNLLETVKGYMSHEKGTLEAIVEARNKAMQSGKADKSGSENALSGALKSLFALSESYPELKASANFIELQKDLTDTETKIQATRQFYNTAVMALNAKVEMFPSNLVAKMFGFKADNYFELDVSEKEAANKAPKIEF